jgi:Holliday junction resolvase RusA-like endonuclease
LVEGLIARTLQAEVWSARKRQANRWHTAKPDADNIAKLVGDALNGIAWRDDAQIARATVEKFYGDEPRLAVRIERLAPRLPAGPRPTGSPRRRWRAAFQGS